MISTLIALAAVAAGFYIWYRVDYRDRDFHFAQRGLTEVGIPKEYCKFKYRYTTKDGKPVISTRPLTGTAHDPLANADIGVHNQLVRFARKWPEWKNKNNAKDYQIAFIEPMATNEHTDPGSPALKVNGVQAAGTCIGLNTTTTNGRYWIAVPGQWDSNWSHNDYLMRSIWNESEHIHTYFNDYAEFQKFTGPNDVHPEVDFDDMEVFPAV